jgi:cytochrome c556
MSSSVLEKKTQFEKAATSFETATAELAAAARNEDLKAIKSQFGKVAQNCGACHKKFQK